jgi:cytochrome c oxidase accessory protein FixG
MGVLPAPERVLPTLNQDGTRRRIRPKLYRGRFYRARRLVGYGLIALFVALPFLRLNGKPLVLLDIPRRQFTLLGSTYLPTVGVLLMLLLLSIFVVIIWVTALVGRAWCGWACPQTVYMELVYRPIERLIEGDRTRQLAIDRRGVSPRRVAKWLVFAFLSVLVANVFLAYFVGTDELWRWVSRSPFDHPTPFLVMAATAGLMYLDFAYFREQMCTTVCPYARLQSVLLDSHSLIIGYDAKRGEPRGKGKSKPGQGDCIDCNACVVACPSGIDIRDGLQLECIACAQCVDACDFVMSRVHKPAGLIRYGSQACLERQEKPKSFRPRVVAYPVLALLLVGALVVVGARRPSAEITVLRGLGAPFVAQSDGIVNQVRVKIENRSQEPRQYRILLEGAPGARLIAPENPLPVAPGSHRTTSLFVVAPPELFEKGTRAIGVRVRDGRDVDLAVPYKLLGPPRGAGARSKTPGGV